jgi:hypothetical protein
LAEPIRVYIAAALKLGDPHTALRLIGINDSNFLVWQNSPASMLSEQKLPLSFS